MKAFVTGATGFVGSYLTQHLIDHGDQVAVLVRPESSLWRIRPLLDSVKVYEAAFHDESAVAQALEDWRPTTCFHLAWSGVAGKNRNDISQIADNLEPSLSLIRTCGKVGCETFIGLGSQAEYGPQNRPLCETDPTLPTTLYGKTKLAVALLGEHLAREASMRFVWGRLFSSYGKHDNSDWLIPYLIRTFLAGRKPSLTPCEQIWDFVHVRDVARALRALAVEPSAQGIFNLGGGQARPLREIVYLIRDLIDPTLPVGIGEVEYRSDQVMHLEANLDHLISTTGWQPLVTCEAGLQECVEDLREQLKALPAVRG